VCRGMVKRPVPGIPTQKPVLMRAAEWQALETIEVVDRDKPVALSGQAVVEIRNCGICGSDLHSFRHGLAARPGQVLGHEFSGVVVAAPDVPGLAVGDRVTVRPLIPCGHCGACLSGNPQRCEHGHDRNIGYASDGAFAQQVLVPRAVVGETVFLLPPEVDDRAGALVEPLAVSLHAVHRADPAPDATVLVLGLGAIGLGVVQFLALRGVGRIVAADPSALRRSRAEQLGAFRTLDPISQNVTAEMSAITGPGAMGLGARVDCVIDCSGAPSAIADALKSLRLGGTLVLAAVFGREISLKLDRVVDKELTVRGVFAYANEFAAVIEHLANGDIDPELFISHTFELEEIQSAFRMQLDPDSSVKVLVHASEPQG
jgi:threonine dehydrogenase-like Zn-dependent dehydrogenase